MVCGVCFTIARVKGQYPIAKTMSDQSESSGGEDRNLYHGERKKPFEPAFGDTENMELISAHIKQHVGEPTSVLHEFVSDVVHIDVHVVAPTPERNCYTLVTSGMSDRAMTTPEDQKEEAFAELMLCLPADWPMEEDALQELENSWPIHLLKYLARMPHEYETWLAGGHTVPNENPPVPYAPNTKFCAVTFVNPQTTPPEFERLKVNENKAINFWAVIPLHLDEINLALKKGVEPLYELLNEHSVTELLDMNRPNTVKKRFGFF